MVALSSLIKKTCSTLDGKYCSQIKMDVLAPLEMDCWLLLYLQYFVFVTLYAENASMFENNTIGLFESRGTAIVQLSLFFDYMLWWIFSH